MSARPRTPLGEIVVAYREQLHLTQLELAIRTSHPVAPRDDHVSVSERTIWEIERETVVSGRRPRVRRPSTIRALADAFGLIPGTREYDAFLAAATATGNEPALSPPDPWPREDSSQQAIFPAPLFVPAGREHHLEHLRTAIDRAVNGHAGVVFVGADPGSGKTALVSEACRQALDRYAGLVVLWGDCTGRSGLADPHQPFRQVVSVLAGDTAAAGPRQLLSRANTGRIALRTPRAVGNLIDGVPGLVDRFVAAQTLRTQVRTGAFDPETMQRLTHALERAAGMPPDAQGPNELVYRVLAAYARQGPVVVVLEDLHWADPGTASMLFHLMRRLKDQSHPLLLISTYRSRDLEPGEPGSRHPLPTLLAEAPRVSDDALLDLSTAVGGQAGAAFVSAMVRRLLPNAPSAVSDDLFIKTAGLPLFVVAMLRWYQVDGLPSARGLREEGVPWDSGHHRPAEIDALFGGLIDRLPPNLAALLEAASVQGASFSFDVVMHVMELSRSTAMDMLGRQLTRRFGVLIPGGVTSVAGHRSHEYQFGHVLLRDYLYHRLSKPEQRHYHAATAEAMVALYGEGEHGGMARIAYHLDRADRRHEAAAAYIMAGLHGMAQQEYDSARRHFLRIGELELGPDSAFVATQALIGLGNCAYGQGQIGRAASLFNQAYEQALKHHLPLLQATCLTSMGRLDFARGNMREGAMRVTRAIDMLIDLGDEREAARAYALLSHIHYGSGQYDEAVRAARASSDMGEHLRDDLVVIDGLTALANCWLDLGQFDEAITALQRALNLCERHGSTHRGTLCWLNLSLCELERDALGEAAAALAVVFDPARTPTSRLLGMAEFNAGLLAERRGHLPRAHRHYRTSFDLRVATGQHALAIDSLAGLLRTVMEGGSRKQVRRVMGQIQSMLERQGLDGVEHPGRLFLTRIHAYTMLGEQDCARFYLNQGLYVINERAARLADPALRTSYLTNVPAHSALRQLGLEMDLPGW